MPHKGYRHSIRALREISRVGKGKSFVRVDSCHTPEQKAVLEDWVLIAEFHDHPDGFRYRARKAPGIMNCGRYRSFSSGWHC